MIHFNKEICTDFETASNREWLETNGIGGFASGTVSGAQTRRYHGMLTAAVRPPLGRITMLSKIEETLIIDGERFELSSNQYEGGVYPKGHEYLTGFRLDPFPIWTWEVEGVEIEKRLFMVNGENTSVFRWSILDKPQTAKGNLRLELRPLLSFVDYHHLQRETSVFNADHIETEKCVTVKPYDELTPLFFYNNADSAKKTGFWYKNFEYAIEKERGFDYIEDHFQPFSLGFDLSADAALCVSTEANRKPDPFKLEEAEIERRKSLIKTANAKDDFSKLLALAADQFIVARGDGRTIIAGYPWFSDWGRDTMISLSGLTLSANRPEIAKEILLEFSNHISQGMLPNRFPDADEEAEYNTVDATLWYFDAIRAYLEKTSDYDFVRESLYEKLADIIAWHLRGTRYNIHVDTDGLLYAGEPGVQLTWMDAKIGDLVITPRIGKPVEIQALWYNALRIMSDLSARFSDEDDRKRYDAMADMCKMSFNAVFWNDAENCLFDVVENGNRDGSVRPNQIFAVSLPYSMLDADRSRLVVEKVESELLTPLGLRSLSPRDSRYVPVYIGSPFERDSAYHQGTVWGWLIGPFVDAYRRVYDSGPEQQERVSAMLAGFQDHLMTAGIGQVSEIFDAETPHHPRGCTAQAWSVAELLRVRTTD